MFTGARNVAPLAGEIMRTTGGRFDVVPGPTVICTGAEVVLAPPSLVATAVKSYAPWPTPDHATQNELAGFAQGKQLVRTPMLVPFSKNSTCITCPSGSWASAQMLIFAGAVNFEPLVGVRIETIGGTFEPSLSAIYTTALLGLPIE